jgi:hypothetical protein
MSSTSPQDTIYIERQRMYLKIVYVKFWAQIVGCMALLGVSSYQLATNGDVKWIGGVTTALGTLARSPSSDLEESKKSTDG